MSEARLVILVNPMSCGGRTASRWPKLEHRIVPILKRAFGSVAVRMTSGPGDATRLAREAAANGAEAVLAAGGDGTVSETLTGLMDGGSATASLGILPFGTGSDLARAMEIRDDVDGLIHAISSGHGRPVDVGSVRVEERTRYFLNIATFGLSGEIVSRISQAGSRGALTYATSTLRAISGWSDKPVTITVDEEPAHSGPLVFGAVANGRYFGGGMHVAPHAVVDDGLFEVVCVRGTHRWKLVRSLPRLYKGTHLNLPAVSTFRGKVVEAQSSSSVWVEADGEPLGYLPARFEIHERRVRLLGITAA